MEWTDEGTYICESDAHLLNALLLMKITVSNWNVINNENPFKSLFVNITNDFGKIFGRVEIFLFL